MKKRSKCEWYHYGKKPTKFFLNIEKQKAINTTVRHLIEDVKDITVLKEINPYICKFYKSLFKKNVSKSISERGSFTNRTVLPSLNSRNFDVCQSEITEKYLMTAVRSVPNGKSYPGYDGLKKEFYKQLWEHSKVYFFNSLKQSKTDGHLLISQRHAIIKLLAK